MNPSASRRHRALLLVLFIASAILSFSRLDNALFWDDEAHVGLIAKGFLKFGYLTGWTGRNLYAYNNGTILDDHLRSINPPLDPLITAASFDILGATTWAGRAPMVVIGLLSLIVFAFVLHRTLKDNAPAIVYSFGALALSVIFLLNIRTCRYYAPALLFGLGIYYAYRGALKSSHWRHFLLLALAGAGLFYSNFMLCVVFLASLATVHLAFHRRDWDKMQWRNFALATLAFLAMTVPYALIFRIWQRPDMTLASPFPWPVSRLILFWIGLRDLNASTYLPWLVVAGIVLFLWKEKKSSRQNNLVLRECAAEWGTIVLAYLFILALVSPQPASLSRVFDIRYFIPILPFCAALCGLFLSLVHRRAPLVAALLFLFLIGSNILTLHPWNREFRWLLPAYLGEVAHPYPTAYSETLQYLQRNARPDETVLAFPSHMNYPLMFYADERLKFCCLLDAQTHLPQSVLRRLDAPLLREENFPQWFIAFGAETGATRQLEYFSRPHQSKAATVKFEYRRVQALDIFWDQTQRPEFFWHRFGPRRDFDPKREAVSIYKRSGPFPVAREH